MMMAPKVSVIIPSLDGYRDGNVPRLISQLKNQTFKDLEIIVIKGVRPNGRARNAGAKKAKGEILISIDDDVTLGHEKVIENLVRYLESDDSIGLLGISKLIPKDSNRFQRKCAKEIPRSTSPIFDELTEGDLVDHMCIAIWKDLYFKVGMENESLIRGTDPDLRYRIRQAGYKIAIAPNSWGYHPMPKTMVKLLEMFFRNGMGSSWVQKHYPELTFHDSVDHTTAFRARTSLQFRIIASFTDLSKSIVCGHFFYFLARVSYAMGFAYGILSGKSGDPWFDSDRRDGI
jgi:glycosyltransferase involved in cell wall biosynthesis